MTNLKEYVVILSAVTLLGSGVILPKVSNSPIATTTYNETIISPAVRLGNLSVEALALSTQAKNLDPKVIDMGLKAYKNAVKDGYTHKKLLTIVDYSKPSNERRLWVFDLRTNKLLFNELVAHGKQSGDVNSKSFSNVPQSNKSSIGVYLTDVTYDGKHGYSLKLEGLDKGFNDNAAARAIVVHSANYVTDARVNETGKVGRSLGCLALDPQVTKPVIDTIKDGTVIFAYYPDQAWIQHSEFLNT